MEFRDYDSAQALGGIVNQIKSIMRTLIYRIKALVVNFLYFNCDFKLLIVKFDNLINIKL
jgi:hypothetical protein